MTDEREQQRALRVEASATAARAAELQDSPVRGDFDAAHLREIHRRLFQDLPGLGYPNHRPGEYRPATPAAQDWIKTRTLSSVAQYTVVAYSPMDQTSVAAIEAELRSRARPEALKPLRTEEFVATISALYSRLDYLHPFADGNSRTLRTFTAQLAREAGYDLDWTRFNRSPAARDVLYVARDISVNRIAIAAVKDPNTRKHVQMTLDRFDGNKDLGSLLRDAIRPLRAVDFERRPEHEAVERHPELKAVYAGLHTIERQLSARFADNPTKRDEYLAAVRSEMLGRLESGGILIAREVTTLQTPDREKDGAETQRPPTDLSR